MKTIPRRCGASMPDRDVRKGWHWCYYEAGHRGMHEDDYVAWKDNETVEVRSVEEIAVVHDHEHDFPHLGQDGDAKCAMDSECQLTWNEYQAQQEWWRQEQEDICSYCGHAAHCHTTSLPEEGRRDYCTECEGKDEFHAMDQEPPESPQERLQGQLRALLAPELPEGRLEAVVGALGRLIHNQGGS